MPTQGVGTRASAELLDAKGASRGKVEFTQTADGVRVQARLSGLTKNSVHGFHVHEGFECEAPSFASAKGHFNPEQKPHGDRHGADRHPGDMGNLRTNSRGGVNVDFVVKEATLNQGINSIMGRALIVHAKADDLKSQPSGDAGDRLACGIIKSDGA